MNQEIQIRVYNNPCSDRIELYGRATRGDLTKCAVASLVFTDVECGSRFAPMAELTQQEAQTLANALWEAGIRPVGAAGSMGQLAAMQAHLDDLRKLVFDKSKM